MFGKIIFPFEAYDPKANSTNPNTNYSNKVNSPEERKGNLNYKSFPPFGFKRMTAEELKQAIIKRDYEKEESPGYKRKTPYKSRGYEKGVEYEFGEYENKSSAKTLIKKILCATSIDSELRQSAQEIKQKQKTNKHSKLYATIAIAVVLAGIAILGYFATRGPIWGDLNLFPNVRGLR